MSELHLMRDPQDADELVAWAAEDRLGPGAQLTCGADEAVVFIDGDEVLLQLGPGRYQLTPASQPVLAKYLGKDAPEIAVAFVRTSPVALEFESDTDPLVDTASGESFTPSIATEFPMQVIDPVALIELYGSLDDETEVEVFVARLVCDIAADELGLASPALDVVVEGTTLSAAACKQVEEDANEELEPHGLRVTVAGPIKVFIEDGGDDEDDVA